MLKTKELISQTYDQTLEAEFDGERFALIEKRNGTNKVIILNCREAVDWAAFVIMNFKLGLTKEELEK